MVWVEEPYTGERFYCNSIVKARAKAVNLKSQVHTKVYIYATKTGKKELGYVDEVSPKNGKGYYVWCQYTRSLGVGMFHLYENGKIKR